MKKNFYFESKIHSPNIPKVIRTFNVTKNYLSSRLFSDFVRSNIVSEQHFIYSCPKRRESPLSTYVLIYQRKDDLFILEFQKPNPNYFNKKIDNF